VRAEKFPIAPAPVLDPGFREQLALYLYFQKGRDVELFMLGQTVVGACLPGAKPFLGIVDGAPVAVAAPRSAREIAGQLMLQGSPAWRERPELVALFASRSLAAGDIGKRPEEIEAVHGLTLAPGGVAVYREKPFTPEATLASVDLDGSGRARALAGCLMFVVGRDMAAYPVAKAVTLLAGPADDVAVKDSGELVLRYFVAEGGRSLEYTLELRPLRGRPETGQDYFGFEIVGRIVDVGAAILAAKPVAR